MAKEVIDSWKWVTDFEPAFELDFVEEEVFSPNVNKETTFNKLESTRLTKRFASSPNEQMNTLLAKRKTLRKNKKNNKLVCDNISMKVEAMQY